MEERTLNLDIFANNSLRILYVEDDITTAQSTLNILKKFFQHIDVAHNGKDGIKKFDANTYDIILTDLDMPVMDGLKMIEYIRKKDKTTSIIIFSCYSDSEYFLESIELGIDGYILKPFNLQQFLSVLHRVLHKETPNQINNENDNFIHLKDNFLWDKVKNILQKNNEIIKLTETEIKVFSLLGEKHDFFAPKEEIYKHLYNDVSHINNEQKFRNILSKLKNKIGTKLIESYYSQGYILCIQGS